jgi:hypothetical protein
MRTTSWVVVGMTKEKKVGIFTKAKGLNKFSVSARELFVLQKYRGE